MRRLFLTAALLVGSAGTCRHDGLIRTHAIPCENRKCPPNMLCVYDIALDPDHPEDEGPGFCARRCENTYPMHPDGERAGDCPSGFVCRGRADMPYPRPPTAEMAPLVCLSAADYRPFNGPLHPTPCVNHQCEAPLRCVYDLPDALDPGFCARPCQPGCPAGSVCERRAAYAGPGTGPEASADVCLTAGDQRASSEVLAAATNAKGCK